MTIRELLAASGSGAKIIDRQVFTASGIWTKPAGVLYTDEIRVELWGGGGGGGKSSNSVGMTGAGGAHNEATLRAGDLAATENVIVGTGGTGGSAAVAASETYGAQGGYSEFRGIRAYGGGGGNPSVSFGSGGGGTLSPGITYGSLSSVAYMLLPGEWGGGSVTAAIKGITPVHGGGCSIGGAGSLANSRDSVYGGGGGGSSYSSDAAVSPPGSSKSGGAGGARGYSTAAGNGSSRGGGGGGGRSRFEGGDGGRGEVVITVIRR